MITARHVLGTVRFTTRSGGPRTHAGGLLMDIHTARPGDRDSADVWTTDQPVLVVPGPRVQYAHDGEVALFAARIPPSPRYAALVNRLYTELFALTVSSGYHQTFRVWQHIENINGVNADGLEVYRDFCLGRAEAFERHRGTAAMPAATAVGAHGGGGGISLHLLAGRERVVPVENPAQVPAYCYPERYGPKPPSFARATWRDRELYVSGTAAIVGHETVHQGDVVAQCLVALGNNRAGGGAGEPGLPRA